MNNDLILRNALLVMPNEVVRGSIAVAGGVIAAVDTGASHALSSENVDGDLLMPGLIEMHTDNLERHLMPRPKVQWPAFAALQAHDAELVAAGITTVFDAIGVGDADPDALRGGDWTAFLSVFDHVRTNGQLRAEHFLHIRCELPAPNTLELFDSFREHSAVKLMSLMDHTVGQRQWEDPGTARIYYTGKKGWTPEKFDAFSAQALELQQRYASHHRASLVNYARSLDIKLASHDDTKPEHVIEARAAGATISEFPTTILAASTAKRLGLSTVMGGPNLVRGGSHSGNVAAIELARLDLLDCLSSDYVPSSLLSGVFALVDQANYSVSRAIACVTSNVADMLELKDRGRIVAGAKADLLQVRLVSTPDGRRSPKVIGVWRDGIKVF